MELDGEPHTSVALGQETTPSIKCSGGAMIARAGLDALQLRKISFCGQRLNPPPSIIQPVGSL